MRLRLVHTLSLLFASMAVAAVLALGGWTALNLTVLPPVLIAMAVVAWHYVARRQMAVA